MVLLTLDIQWRCSCLNAAGLAYKNHRYAHMHLVGSPHALGGKPTCTWWVAPQVVFFPRNWAKNTTKKTFCFYFELDLSLILIPVSRYNFIEQIPGK
jgi:hypothetical protein